jgi:predicted transglutaminase-like cysteine proteinase
MHRLLIAAVLVTAAFSPKIAGATDLRDPFDLPGVELIRAIEGSAPEDLVRKSRELQDRIKQDLEIVRTCDPCAPEVVEFKALVTIANAESGRKRFGLVNRAIKEKITPTSDLAQYGQRDYWASPLETLRSRKGDCEDFAILKYAIFLKAKVPQEDLRLLIVDDRGEDHMVLVVRLDNKWIVLDNRTLTMADLQEVVKYDPPKFLLDPQGGAQHYEHVSVHN